MSRITKDSLLRYQSHAKNFKPIEWPKIFGKFATDLPPEGERTKSIFEDPEIKGFYTVIGARLESVRRARGISRPVFGKLSGCCNDGTLYKYEKGLYIMPPIVLWRASYILDVPISYFFDLPSRREDIEYDALHDIRAKELNEIVKEYSDKYTNNVMEDVVNMKKDMETLKQLVNNMDEFLESMETATSNVLDKPKKF
jgi:transcriptional regulator with XRE-family HTH domain